MSFSCFSLYSFLDSFASFLEIAPSATARIVNDFPALSRLSMMSTMASMSYGISGRRMMSAPPAIPACNVTCPTLCPMTSIMNTLLWEVAVVWMRSIVSVAMSTALWNPNVISVPHKSLSIVFGRPITFNPSSRSRLAVFCVPFPPRMTRQSRLSLWYVCFIAATLSKPSLSGTRISLNGCLEVPRIVPPRVKMPEKSLDVSILKSP